MRPPDRIVRFDVRIRFGLLVKDQINILSISSRRLYPVQQKKTRPEILFQTSLTLVFPLPTREAGDS